MLNKQKYDNAFMASFSISQDELNNKLVYQSIPAWDSVGHMGLMTAIEEAFNITLEMDDILDFSSYGKGVEILQKYDVIL